MDTRGRTEAGLRQSELMKVKQADNNQLRSPHSLRNRILRAGWQVVWLLLFRPSPRILHRWRRGLLRVFGSRIGMGVYIHPSVRIWAPWNLEMGDFSCLGHSVDCYNVAPVRLGQYCTVSQYSHLCAATHDYTRLNMALVTKPISLGARVWIAADVFVGPGVNVEEGAVIGARSSVYSNVRAWTVVGGNPARFIKARMFEDRTVDTAESVVAR